MDDDFHVGPARFLSSEGELDQSAGSLSPDPGFLLQLYRAMTRTRVFDGKAIALQRTGKLGTFPSALGQEAIGVGVAHAMLAKDVLFPYYRDHAALFLRGVTMAEMLLYWGGDERGGDFRVPREDFPICVPVGSQVAHAAGAAYAFKLRREKRVAVCTIGDGGTAKGDFYEALNLAGVWNAPLVVVINNNRWAISTPRELESAAATLAQKAVAAGIEGRQVDGNDVIAVHEIASQAIGKARSGGGPTLIEALSYRLGDHTTADDATRYRDPTIVQREWAFEPIGRLRAYLTSTGVWNRELETELLKQCSEEVEKAVETYLTTPPRDSDAMFEHLFASLPRAMHSQRDEARRFDPLRGARHE